ncbi:MAG TPA: regulatory iron-sulfur-containing complex subunit RicT [bacterium]|nr:regulatory iron-sulfur-containing complex subunit RicT [bacterium]HPN43798.1 regulatory iron-sulfur-containing complex subunit RicT [bacterium]
MIEVVFKGERKELYENPQEFPFLVGDFVIVEAEKGEDLGVVNQIGSRLKRKKEGSETRNIIRKPSRKDLDRFYTNRQKELEAFKVCRTKIGEHGLDMKLVGVEYQFDGQKITFYFTAEQRVDFRELVKELASIYKVRIELRQIGVRDEAKRIGGHGSCGRKLCCTTFLKEFEPITTQCAKEQNLPLNPQKLSGLCGRLLCCLMYEREFYKIQAEKLPPVGTKIKMPQAEVLVTELDVFKELVTVMFPDEKREKYPYQDLEKYEMIRVKVEDDEKEKEPAKEKRQEKTAQQ